MRSLLRFRMFILMLAVLLSVITAGAEQCNLGTSYFFDMSSNCPGPGRELCTTGRMYLFNTWANQGKKYLIGSTYTSAIFYDVTDPVNPRVAVDPGAYQPWGEAESNGSPDDDRQQWDVAMLDGYQYGIAMFQNFGWSAFQVQILGGVPAGFTTTDRYEYAGVQKNSFIPTSSPAHYARLFHGGDGNVFAVGSWLNRKDSGVVVAQFTNGRVGSATMHVSGVAAIDPLETVNVGGKWWLFAFSRNNYRVLVFDLSGVTAAALSNPLANPGPLASVATIGSSLTDVFLDKDNFRLLTLNAGNVAAKVKGTATVYNVANPAAPVVVTTIATAAVDSRMIAAAGDLVVVAQASPFLSPWMQAFSITNPGAPVEVGAGQLDHVAKNDEQLQDIWVGKGSPNFGIYGAAFSAGFVTQVSASCLSTDPHAAFTVTGGSTSATCAGTPTGGSTGVAAKGFPGDTFTIADGSSGVMTGKTVTITPATGGSPVFQSTWNVLTGGWSVPLTWTPPANTEPGEYLVTMTATSSTGAPTSTLVQSIFLCGNPFAALAVSEQNGIACTNCSAQLLVNDNLKVSAAATTGHPSGYNFYVIPGGGGDEGLPASDSTLASPYTLSAKNTYTFGVVAHYDFVAATTACSGVPTAYLNANPTAGGYNACSMVQVSADYGVSAFEVWQNGQLAVGSGQSGIILIDQPTTLKFTGKVASGHVPNFVWAIPGVSSALTCAYTSAPYTGSTCPIPANTWTANSGQLTMNMTLQVCNGSPGVDCGSSSLATIAAPPVLVTPSQYSFAFHVSNTAPAVGQPVGVVLDSMNGAFSSLTFNYGGQACDGNTQKTITCGSVFGIPGSDPCTPGNTLTSFSYSSTGPKTVSATGVVGTSSVTATSAGVNVSAGSCPSQALTVNSSPAAPTVGANVTFTTTPSMTVAGDTLTFQFGDGQQQTISYPTACALGTCVASHAYSGAATYTVTATGTVGGISRSGSTSVTVTTGGPSSTTVTISANPASPMAGNSVIFTTTPQVSAGDSLTFQFGDGSQGVLSYPCPLGACSIAHTYSAPGTFNVTASGTVGGIPATGSLQLTVQNPCQYPAAPVANFSWSPAQQRATVPIQFTDLSTGNPTAWSWSFGDAAPPFFGGGTSTQQNPLYTFPRDGTFTVTLTVSNCRGQSTKQFQVTVLPACTQAAAPAPDFTWGPTGPLASFPEQSQPYVGRQVTLTDASSNSPVSWHWYDFQEGNVNTTATTPTLTYTWNLPGDKNVRMTAKNCFGESAEKLKIVHIYDDVRHVTADFTWSPADVSTTGPTTFTAAQGYANGDPTDFSWSFDDGTTLTGASVAHTYKCAGSHKVTLTSTRKNASGLSTSATVTKGFTVGGTLCGPESVMAVDAAKVLGLNNTNWHADLRIFNASKYATNIWLEFLPAGTDNVQPFKVGPYQPPLPPKGTLVLDDILQWAADNFKQNFTKAALRITYKNDDNIAPIILVRTYNLLPDGSKYGQMNPGIAVLPGTTKSPMWLTGLRNNGTETGFRTNYSIVNLRGDTSCASCITFTLFDETGAAVGTKNLGLWAFGYIQDSIKNLFGASFANIGTFSLKIDIPSGQDMQAYASVMDNLTGDPVMITATPPADSPIYLVAMAHNGGVGNTVWRTDLQITNPDSAGPHSWEVKYIPKTSDGLPAVSRSVTLAPNKSLFVNDAVEWAYSGLLPADAETSGVIRIAPTDGTGVYPVVAARSFNLTPTGTFGQGIPALWAARGVSATSDNKRLLLTGLSSEDIARTNLGILNLSETDGVDMAVYFYDESGNLLNPLNQDGTPAPYTYGNGPGTWDQDKLENRFNRAFKSFGKTLPANLRSISAEIVVRGGGPAFVYASVIDSLTGDPNFIAAQPAP